MNRAAPSAPSIDVAACALCGSRSWAVAIEDPPYSVRRCRSCDLVWVSPRHTVEALAELYGEDYWRSESPKSKGYSDYRRDESLYLKTFRRRSELVRRHVDGRGRALDVGCAAGFFMKVLAEDGFEVHGVELSPEIAQHATETLGADAVHVGTLEGATFAPASFDLVTMWDVVEHVPDPVSLLEAARALIKPDGVLLLETQNINSAFARVLRKRWHHFKHQEHLYHFNRTSIARLLADTGFEVDLITPWFAGKYVSLSFIAERAARVHPILSTALRPLSKADASNVYVNLLDEMIVVARPKIS